MNFRACLFTSAVFLLPLAASPASAQEASSTPKPAAKKKLTDTTPETIVVTSSRRAENIKNVPESISVVSRTQIRAAAAQTIDQVLRYVPSVDLPAINVSDNFPTSSSVSMRGLSGTRALVLLDGIPLHDVYFGSIQWNRVPLENIQQLEIVRGADATLWGNYAMGGVINVITQSPTKNEVLVSGGGGSYGTYRTNLYASYLPTSWARFSVDYGYNQTLGYDEVPEDVRTPIDRKTQNFSHNIALNGDFDLGKGWSAGVRLFWNQNSQPLQLVTNSSNYSRNWTYSGHLTKTLADASTLTANAFHTQDFFWTNNVSVPSFNTDASIDYIQDSHHTSADDVGGSLVWASSIPGWIKAYSVGVDAHQLSGTDDDLLFTDPVENGPILGAGQEIASGDEVFAGGFGQITLNPIKPLDIVFSARYQYYDSYNGNETGVQGNASYRSRASYDFLPRLSLRYKLSKYFALRAAGYEAFRAPTLNELYRTVAIQTGVFYANPNLSPEKLKGGEVGFDIDKGRFNAQVTGYYNHITNLITSRDLTSAELPAGDFFGSRNINAGSAKSEGVEAEVHWRLAQGLMLIGGYTYAYSPITNNAFDPDSVGKQQTNVPRHKIAGSLSYTAPGGWKITPQLLWMTREWGDNDHTLPVNEHFVVDLTASYPVTNRIEAFGEVQNLFDRKYIGWNDGGSAAMLGEPLTVFGGLRIRIW